MCYFQINIGNFDLWPYLPNNMCLGKLKFSNSNKAAAYILSLQLCEYNKCIEKC